MKKSSQPTIAAVIPSPPEGLSERSKSLWNSIVTGLTPLPRRAAVESALRSLDAADAAAAVVAAEGMTFTNPATNVAHVHPATKIEKDCRAAFHRSWSALNLNTSRQPWTGNPFEQDFGQ